MALNYLWVNGTLLVFMKLALATMSPYKVLMLDQFPVQKLHQRIGMRIGINP